MTSKSSVATFANTDAVEAFGTYDFGLSQQQEERAARLHAESIIIDMMFSGPCGHRSFTPEMQNHLRATWNVSHDVYHTMFESMKLPGRLAVKKGFTEYKECWDASGVTAGSRNLEVGTYESYAHLASHYTAEFDHLPWLIKALRANDFRRAKAEGKHAAFFYCQPLHPVNSDLSLLNIAEQTGLRMLQLTYNNLDAVGAGCTERTDAGLSNFGVKVVERLNDLGVIVDTSHCGRQTTLDACKVSRKPVLACHTSAEVLYGHVRSKSDDEIRAIAGTGGVIGIYALPCFLAQGQHLSVEVMLDHIQYVAELVGWDHVGLGTDWPLQMPKWLFDEVVQPLLLGAGFRPGDVQGENLVGFDDYRDYPNFTRGLVKRGCSDQQIKGVLGENFLRVFQDVCG